MNLNSIRGENKAVNEKDGLRDLVPYGAPRTIPSLFFFLNDFEGGLIMERHSNIAKKATKDQMVLSYDCLIPEEAYKILDALFADDMCEILQWMEIELSYAPYGTIRDGEKVWVRDLVLWIRTPEIPKNHMGADTEDLLEADRGELEHIARTIKERTGVE